MYWFYRGAPAPMWWNPAPYIYPVSWERRIPVYEGEQLQPYLTTWPYSNVYYGNYFES